MAGAGIGLYESMSKPFLLPGRGPKDCVNRRILQYTISRIPPILGLRPRAQKAGRRGVSDKN